MIVDNVAVNMLTELHNAKELIQAIAKPLVGRSYRKLLFTEMKITNQLEKAGVLQVDSTGMVLFADSAE